mgnify:CR=1 FL=1
MKRIASVRSVALGGMKATRSLGGDAREYRLRWSLVTTELAASSAHVRNQESL